MKYRNGRASPASYELVELAQCNCAASEGTGHCSLGACADMHSSEAIKHMESHDKNELVFHEVLWATLKTAAAPMPEPMHMLTIPY
jgi:hypothetical protein